MSGVILFKIIRTRLSIRMIYLTPL